MSMEILVDVSAAQKNVKDLRGELRGAATDIDNIFSAAKGKKIEFGGNVLGEFNKLRAQFDQLNTSLSALNKNLGSTKKGFAETANAGSGMASTARVVQQVVGAVSTALNKQTKELKAVTRATKESADAEEASAKAKQRAQQIITQTMTMEQRYAKVKKEITALEKEGLLATREDATGRTVAARALEMQKKALQSVGTEIEVYIRKQQVMLDQFGKTNVELLRTKSGWKLLTIDQQNAAIALQRTSDALSVVNKYTKETFTPLQQLRKELAALHSLKPGSNKDSPLSSKEYQRARAEIERLIAVETTRIATLEKTRSLEASRFSVMKSQGVISQQLTTYINNKVAAEEKDINALHAAAVAEDKHRTSIQKKNEKLHEAAILEDTVRTKRSATRDLNALHAEALAEDRRVNSIRNKVAALERELTTIPRVTTATLSMAKGYDSLSDAEKRHIENLERLQGDMRTIEGLFKKGADPVTTYKTRIEAATRALQAFRASGGLRGISPDQFLQVKAGATQELERAQQKASALRGGLLGLAGGMNVANQATAAFRATMMGANLSFGMFTSSTILAATAAYGFAKAMTTTMAEGKEFEYMFSRISVMMASLEDIRFGADTDQLAGAKAVRAEILALAETTQFSAMQVAEGADILARSGMDAAGIYLNLESVLDLAAVGMMDMKAAADIATAAMAGFKLEGREFTYAVDVLAATATKTKASVEDIGKSLEYIGPIAHQAGIEFHDVSAAMGVLSDVNIRASKAGTAYRRVITNLVAPTKSGKLAFKELGIEISEFTKNGVLNVAGFFQRLKAGGATIEQLKMIFGQYALSAAAALTENADRLDDLGRSLSDVGGYAAQVRQELRDNLKSALEELSDVWSALQIRAYAFFGPGLRDKVDQFTDFLRANSESIAQTLGKVADALVSMGAFLASYGGWIAHFAASLITFKLVGSAIGGLAPMWKRASGAISDYRKRSAEAMETALLLGRNVQTSGRMATTAGAAWAGFKAIFGGWLGIALTAVSVALPSLISWLFKGEKAAFAFSSALDEAALIMDRLPELSDKHFGRIFDAIEEDVKGGVEELARLEAEFAALQKRIEEAKNWKGNEGFFGKLIGSGVADQVTKLMDQMKAKREEIIRHTIKQEEAENRLAQFQAEAGRRQLDSLQKQEQAALDAAVGLGDMLQPWTRFSSEVSLLPGKIEGADSKMRGFLDFVIEGLQIIARLIPSSFGAMSSAIDSALSGFRRMRDGNKPNGKPLGLFPAGDIGAPYSRLPGQVITLSPDEDDPTSPENLREKTSALKTASAELTKYFEAYQKGMGSIQGVVKELADADAWIAKIRASSPEAMAAMKEMGFTAEQAVKAVEWNQQQTIIAELEKQLGRIDPRLADFSKEMKTATTTMLTSEQASAAVAEALEDMASQGMNIGPVKDMIESLGDAAATAVSKTAGLNEQWGELVRNAIKLEVGIAGTGESFDALIERFSKFADPETVERVLALSVAGEAVAEALRTSVPEADQMAKMQQALNILLEKGIISQRTYAIALKQTADSLPIGQLKEENAQLRMRIALTQTNARTQAIYTRLMGQFGSTLEGVTDEFIAAANANYELNEELARIEEMQAAWKQFGEGIVGTFADYLSGVEDSWSSTMDSLKGMFKKLLRDLIYQALMNQITINANVTGSSSGGGGGGGWMQQLFGAAMNWFGGGGASAGGGAVVGQGNTWTQGMAYLDTASLVAGAGSGSILGPSGGGGTTASGNSYGSLMSTASNVNTMRMVNSAVSMVFGQGFTNGFTAGLTGTAYTTGQLGANFVGPVAPGYGSGATAGMAGLGLAGLTGAYMGWNRTQGYQRYGAAAGYAALGIGAAGAMGGAMAGTGMIAGATGAFSGAGAALGASSAATATGVGAGGAAAAAGSMGWVPIVGWALAIAALVDYASGGKVFGTKFRPDEINTSMGINAAGESFTSARMTEWRYKGHDHNWMGALTGGLSDIGDWGDREYRETDLEAPDALVDAADQMFIQMAKVARKAARRFNNEIGPLIEGAFNTNIQFTKKGKQSEEDPEEWWTIMGKRYDEDFETGFKRFKGFQVLSQIAANLTAAQIGRGGKPWNPTEEEGPGGGGGSPRPGTDQPTAPKSIRDQLKEVADDIRTGSFGIEDASAEWSESFAALMSIAQRWEGSADMFLDGANFLLEAGVDLYNGIGLLGDTGTLAEITDIVELYQEENESLVQTYQKLKAGVELVHHTLDIFGAAVDRTQKQYLLFSADLIESLGGLEAATTLLGNFHQVMRQFGTYSQYQGSQQRTARSRMLTDLGLDPEITAQEFAQRFSEELQNGLSGADAALWIQASESLVNVHLALEEMSMQAGLTSQSVRDQVEQQILAIQALGANEMELARARELGNQILARALDDFMSGINQQLAEFVGPAGNYARQVRGITSAMEANLRTAEDLGASEIELWQIRRLAEYQMAALVDEITQQIRKLRAAFYGGGLTEEGSNPVADQIGEQTDAARELYEQEMRRYEMAQDAIKSIGEYLDSLKVGDLSPESWSNRLGEARSQFFDLVRRAPTDPEAMGQVVGSADTLLTMARELFGTTDAYEAIYRMVTGSLEGLQLSLGDIAKPEEPSNYGGGTPDSPIVTESTELDKFDLALQIAQSIGALGLALDVNVFELLEKFGIPLLDLVNAMGIDMKLWNEESLFNLRLLASALGVSIPELLAAMNVDIKAVATAYGYQVGVISADNWNVMRELARVLGLDLITLAASIESDFSVVAQGIQGSIKDIINQDIPDLPDNIAAELEPLLTAVGNAANPKEVKAAIDALNDFMKDKLTAEQSAAFTQSLIDAGLIPDAPSPTDAATEAADRAATKDNTKATFDEVKKSNDTYFAAWTPMFQAMATALQAQAAENTPAAQAAAAASDGKYAAAEAQAATMHAVTERMVLAEESMRALMADVARGAREQTKEQKASNQTLRKINKNTRTRERTRSKVK